MSRNRRATWPASRAGQGLLTTTRASTCSLVTRSSRSPARSSLAYAALDLDHVVAIGNLHLPSWRLRARGGARRRGTEKVLALERSVRLPEIRPVATCPGPLARAGTPTFLTGDFNSPSHLDWTAAIAAPFPQRVPFPLAWPVSSALARSGFRDSYREAHPDPVAGPGLSWTAGTPPPRIRTKETLDRIDWVMATGPSTHSAGRLVGETGEPEREWASPWPSDHRAVASSFVVSPKAPPAGERVPALVTRGERVTLRYTRFRPTAARSRSWPGSDRPLMSIPIYDASDHLAPLSAPVPCARRLPGRPARPPWGVLAARRSGSRRAARGRRSGRARTSFEPGAPIRLVSAGAPADRHDWIGIYPAGDPTSTNTWLHYTGARPSGNVTFTQADLGKLPAGRYRATRNSTTATASSRRPASPSLAAHDPRGRCAAARGPVLEIVIDRPKANAIDRTTSAELHEAFARLRDDPDLRVGILTGGGRALLLGWLGPQGGRRRARRIHRATSARAASPGSPRCSTSTSP